jgi:hypothetical protein
MYILHQNIKLQELFSRKPYQGADPATAQFIFFRLEADFDPDIAKKPYFSEIVAYLEDGVEYWKQRGYHHPFCRPGYRGDGALYHKRFAEIGFTPDHADQVSFVELLDVPTSSRIDLKVDDLKVAHLDRLRNWVLYGKAAYIFIPPGVAHLLLHTMRFAWLHEVPIPGYGPPPVLFHSNHKTVFSPFHFSCVGKNCPKKDRDLQIRAIGELIKPNS